MEIYVKNFREGALGILEFGNPYGNSLNQKSITELHEQLLVLNTDKKVKVIILQSAGCNAFCGGASFAEMKKFKNLEQATKFFMGLSNLINTLRTLSKFVVARIQGKVVGGGVGLVAACDYAIAHQDASIKLSELSIGIGPYVIEPIVSRRIGLSAFAQLSIDAENWKNSKWALDKGLYADVVENEDELNKKLGEITERISKYSPTAVRKLKKLHWKNTDHWDSLLSTNAEITAKLILGKDSQEILKRLYSK